MIKLWTYEFENVYVINDDGQTIDSLNDTKTFNFTTIAYKVNEKASLIGKIIDEYGAVINSDNYLYMIVAKHRLIDAHNMFVKCISEICSLFNN